ncbi:MAG: exodeoxyribonuclease III [Proteobacteria bacterium]|nr:exodeoxyribonuclease III [Pseudomonadota bacterium]NOG61486.1 exodeoxyribonuclease III [Pseudomonadota bacterium]
MFKIATWNVNSLKVRLPHVLQWLESERPDVLALQETKSIDENFPLEEINQAGYQVSYIGQKTYNGVATLCKSPIEIIATSLPDYDDEQRRVLAIKNSGVTVLNLYVPNGSEVDSDKYRYKLKWFSKLHPFIKQLQEDNDRLIILGDFNIAPEDQDVHDPKEWEGSVLVSSAERNEFNKLLSHGLKDCFRLFDQDEKSFSWWDYRAAAFRRGRGMRIDHILASESLSGSCHACYIDKEPRKLERPSDHTPVVAEFDL